MKLVFGIGATFWAVIGFSLLIGSAIYRLFLIALKVDFAGLTSLQYVLLVGFSIFMLHAEGYRGFHKQLCPRFASRAKHLLHHPKILSVILAPFYCVGYFYATKRRMAVSYILTVSIITLVLLVRLLDQPWRGIIDVGVVLGLSFGLLSLYYHLLLVLLMNKEPVNPEFN